MPPMNILLIEDDDQVGRLVQRVLSAEGYVVELVASGDEGLRLALTREYDGIVLDLGLGDRDGLTIVQEIRSMRRSTPILVLTGDATERSTVQALDAGADEYVIKPVPHGELVARVRALLRRRDRLHESELLSAGSLTLNRFTRDVSVHGTPLALSPREFGLLEHLMLHHAQVVTRSELLKHVWSTDQDPGTNVVDVHVGRLRRKLALADADARIETVRSAGIMLVTI